MSSRSVTIKIFEKPMYRPQSAVRLSLDFFLDFNFWGFVCFLLMDSKMN